MAIFLTNNKNLHMAEFLEWIRVHVEFVFFAIRVVFSCVVLGISYILGVVFSIKEGMMFHVSISSSIIYYFTPLSSTIEGNRFL